MVLLSQLRMAVSKERQKGAKRSRLARRLRRWRSWTLAHPASTTAVSGLALAISYYALVNGVQQTRLLSILDGVVGGVIASLATYAVVQSIYLQRSAHSLRHWLRFGHRNVWVFPTAIEHPTESRYAPHPYFVVPPFDAQATGVLTHVLRRAHYTFPQRKTVGSHVFDKTLLTDNIVTLCLPTRNVYSRVFLGVLREIYQLGRSVAEATADANVDAYVRDLNCDREYFGFKSRRRDDGSAEWKVRNFNDRGPNRWLTSTINDDGVVAAHANGNIAIDYGLILKAPNPFNPDAGVLIVGGIHGIGTLGASLYLFDNADRMLESHSDEPQVHLVEVSYAVPVTRENYVDAEIHPPLLLVSSRPLSDLYADRDRDSSAG